MPGLVENYMKGSACLILILDGRLSPIWLDSQPITPEINFGASQTRSMNQVSNSLIPEHMVAQQHQWNAGIHFLQAIHPSILDYSTPLDSRTRRG